MLKQNKGITLIALVITIIVMMILVAVSVTVALNGGLFNTAKTAGGRTQKEADKETLTSMVIGAYDNTTYSINKEKLTQNLESAAWGLSGEETEGDVTYFKCISPKGNAFKVNLVTGEIEEDTGIHIEYGLLDAEGNKVEGYTTEESVTISIENIVLTQGGNLVSFTPITSEGITVIEEGKKFSVTQNGTYKFKLVDSNGNETEISIAINCFDKEGPEVKVESLPLECYINSKVKAKVTITDEGSGVDFENCKWVINQTATEIGTNVASYTGGSITSEIQEIETANMTTKGDYYLHVLATDKAGNATEKISEKITVIHAYVITTPQEFQNMGNDLAGNYIIANDIDMTGYDYTTVNGNFSGSIDGQGYTISNLNIKPNGNSSALFTGASGNVSISNLLIKNVTVSGSKHNNAVFFGGSGSGGPKISFNKVGISGVIYGDSTNKSSEAPFVSCRTATSNTWGEISLIDCYARVNLKGGWQYSGGLVHSVNGSDGITSVVAQNCYWSGENIDTGGVGYLIGKEFPENNVNVENCFYNKEIFSKSDAENHGEIGLTTEEMGVQSNYANWDFENTWYMKDGYPELKF